MARRFVMMIKIGYDFCVDHKNHKNLRSVNEQWIDDSWIPKLFAFFAVKKYKNRKGRKGNTAQRAQRLKKLKLKRK